MKHLSVIFAALLLSGCISSTPDFRDTVASAKAAVAPSVVYIRVIYNDTQSGKDRKGQASGSGVIISADGEVLTNHHVIDKTTEIRCQLADGRSFPAKIIGKDKDLDIALLKLELPTNHAELAVAELSPRWLEVGEIVLAMGARGGLPVRLRWASSLVTTDFLRTAVTIRFGIRRMPRFRPVIPAALSSIRRDVSLVSTLVAT